MPRAMVLATANKKADINTFVFLDKSANKSFASNSQIAPWSPYTGKATVRKDMEKRVLSAKMVKEKLTKLAECPTCRSAILINKVAAADKSLQKHLYCPVCATDLHAEIPSTEDSMTLVPEGEDTAVNNEMFPAIDPENEELNLLNTDDMTDVSTRNGDDESSEADLIDTQRKNYLPMASKKNRKKAKSKAQAVKASKKNKKHKKTVSEDGSTEPSRNNAPLTKRKAPAQIDNITPEVTAKNTDVTYQAATGEPVTATVNKGMIKFSFFANTNLKKADLSVVPVTATKSYLFANEVPVLVLRANKADKEIAPLFASSEKLLNAIATTIAAGTFEPIKFGAKQIKASITLDALTESRQRKFEAKLKSDYETLSSTHEAKFFDALCVAAVAVNKNTVQNHPNTLKAAIVKEMAANGVRNPNKIVDAVFSAEGENFLRNVLAYAKDFASKPRSAQKEIKKFVASASYNTTESDVNNDVAEHLSDSSLNVAALSISRASENDDEPLVTLASDTGSDVSYYAGLLRK